MEKETQKKVQSIEVVQAYFEQQRLKDLQSRAKLTQKCLVYNEFMNKVFKEAQEGRNSYLMSLIEEAIRSLEEVNKIYGHIE